MEAKMAQVGPVAIAQGIENSLGILSQELYLLAANMRQNLTLTKPL
jgi:hypothetical protein